MTTEYISLACTHPGPPLVDQAHAKNKNKKHKGRTMEVSTKASNSTNLHKRKSLKALEPQLKAEIEKGTEESDGNGQQLKRQKTSMSLHQTGQSLFQKIS